LTIANRAVHKADGAHRELGDHADESEDSVLGWERTLGMCQAVGEGRFHWPETAGEASIAMRQEELTMLLSGIATGMCWRQLSLAGVM